MYIIDSKESIVHKIADTIEMAEKIRDQLTRVFDVQFNIREVSDELQVNVYDLIYKH